MMLSMKSVPAPLTLPDRTTHAISVKMPVATHRAIIAYAGRRAAERGERVTESDVVRAILTEWLATPEARR